MAAQEYSFDIASKPDMQEVRNAVDQAQREIANRYDFKGSNCEIELGKDEISIHADDEFRYKQMQDVLLSKFVKRNVDMRFIEYGKPEQAAGMSLRVKAKIKEGISQDHAKPLIKQIKDKGLKVQAQIQGDAIRVSSKDKDELQKVIAFVKGLDLPIPVTFLNYR